MGLIDFALPLGLTLVLEGAVALVWGLRGRDLLLFALVNLLTNPIAVLIHALFPGRAVTAGMEIGIAFAEGLCYSRWGTDIRRAGLFSLAANAFSFCAGWVIGIGIHRLI